MNRQHLSQAIAELEYVLTNDPGSLIDHFENEPLADEVKLIYSPRPGKQQSSSANFSHAIPALDTESNQLENTIDIARTENAIATDLPVNFRCNLCPDRMYPVRKYYRQGSLPILVVHHTGNFMRMEPRRDMSLKYIMGSAAEDELFKRMLAAAGKVPADLHYQEYLACHFNPERSMEEDWNERGSHCLNHLKDSIHQHHIQLLLLTGTAAVLLLGEDKARECSRTGEIISLPLGSGSNAVAAMCIRSPAALLALEQKRNAAKAAGDNQAWQKLVHAEKSVKKQILSALNSAFAHIDVQ